MNRKQNERKKPYTFAIEKVLGTPKSRRKPTNDHKNFAEIRLDGGAGSLAGEYRPCAGARAVVNCDPLFCAFGVWSNEMLRY